MPPDTPTISGLWFCAVVVALKHMHWYTAKMSAQCCSLTAANGGGLLAEMLIKSLQSLHCVSQVTQIVDPCTVGRRSSCMTS